MGRYVFTPARRAALKRAQAKSAAKRKGRGVAKSQYRSTKKQAKTLKKSKQSKARNQYYRTINTSYKKNGIDKYDKHVEHARRGRELGGIAQAIGNGSLAYANQKYAVPLAKYEKSIQGAAVRKGAAFKGSRVEYRSTKRVARAKYKSARRVKS